MADGKVVAPEGADNIEVNVADTLQPWETSLRGPEGRDLGDALFGGWESAKDDPDADGDSLESDEDEEEVELDEVEVSEDEFGEDPDEDEDEEPVDPNEEDESEVEVEDEVSEEEELFKVVLPGGEEAEVTLDELTKGYSRQSDYTRKTQEVAEVRKQAEEARAKYVDDLKYLKGIIETVKPEEPDWAALRQENPAEYAALREDYKEFDQRLGAIREEMSRVEQEALEQQQAQMQEFAQKEYERLMQVYPEWKDPAVREEKRQELWSFAQKEYGMTEQELSQVVDHRVIRLLNDALTAKTVKETVKKVPRKTKGKKVLRPGAANRKAPSKQSKVAKERAEAANRWRKTGSAQDALGLFETFVD